jgi:chromosomal replication initiation ATPase DnaA
MYLCQQIGGHRLIDIALKFRLKRTGSIPVTLAKLKDLLEKDKELQNKLNSSI